MIPQFGSAPSEAFSSCVVFSIFIPLSCVFDLQFYNKTLLEKKSVIVEVGDFQPNVLKKRVLREK